VHQVGKKKGYHEYVNFI